MSEHVLTLTVSHLGLKVMVIVMSEPRVTLTDPYLCCMVTASLNLWQATSRLLRTLHASAFCHVSQSFSFVILLLVCTSGIEGRLSIVAATNRPNVLDPALRRPGRLDREIAIPVPGPMVRLLPLHRLIYDFNSLPGTATMLRKLWTAGTANEPSKSLSSWAKLLTNQGQRPKTVPQTIHHHTHSCTLLAD